MGIRCSKSKQTYSENSMAFTGQDLYFLRLMTPHRVPDQLFREIDALKQRLSETADLAERKTILARMNAILREVDSYIIDPQPSQAPGEQSEP